MAGILFGKRFPNTQKYEEQQNRLRNDYARFQKLENSSLFQRYQELDREIHSGDFEQKVHELKHRKFKDTQQYLQLKRYKELSKNKEIKTYLKFYRSGKSKRMQDIFESDAFKNFKELQKYLNSAEFHKVKSGSDFKKSEAYQKYKTYRRLKKNKDIRWALKTEKTETWETFKKLEENGRIAEYYELKAIVESPEFKDFKSYMEDRHRFKKSNEAALLKEYADLKKHKDIIWVLRKREEKPFEDIKKWELSFEDNFNTSSLDTNKWITGYYWGKALMNDTYSLEGEKQYYTSGNIEIRDSVLRIITRKEQIEGKVWNPTWGFRKETFDYTSGLISTGQSFRQQYGRFEAKVRFSKAYPFINAFWMVGEKMVPHVDIFKSMYPGGRLLEAGIIADVTKKNIKESTKRIEGARFTRDYYIYSLDWSEKEMVWRINGVDVYRQTHNIPEEPMYLTFCTTLPEEPKESDLPAVMEIDWIRCFQETD